MMMEGKRLYLPVLGATVGALGFFALLTQAFNVHLALALLAAGLPWGCVLGWALLLKQGRPSGFDIDFCQQLFGRGNFTRMPREQRELAG